MTEASTHPQAQSVCRTRSGARLLAEGRGWRAKDLICTAGPQDPPFEERHDHVSIAVVLNGCFKFRSARGAVVFSPGSLLLSGARETYECSHEHSIGDRCLSFQYETAFFERLAVDCTKRARITFPVHRLPQLPFLVPLVALAQLGASQPSLINFEEFAYDLAAQILTTCFGISPTYGAPTTHDERRVAAAVGFIEEDFAQPITIGGLAQLVGLSPFHFLRTFRRVMGITPHQFLLRRRLREAAWRLSTSAEPVLNIALDSGFGDLSNFNHSFRATFGTSPTRYRVLTHSSDHSA